MEAELQPPCPLEALNRLGLKLSQVKTTYTPGRKVTVTFTEDEINLYGRALARVVLLGKVPA